MDWIERFRLERAEQVEAMRQRILDAEDVNAESLINRVVETGYPVELLHLLLERGADLEDRRSQGERTPLYNAANGSYHFPGSEAIYAELVAALIEAGAEVDAVDGKGDTALWSAAWDENVEIVRLLLGAGADPLRRCGDAESCHHGNNTLHCAASNGSAEVIALLLAAGVDPNQPNARGEVPLHAAADWARVSGSNAFRDKSDLARALIEGGAEVNAPPERYGRTPLGAAVDSGHSDSVVKVLLEAGAVPTPKEEPGVFHTACEKAMEGLVETLLAKGLDPNLEKGGRRPLHRACTAPSAAIVEQLLGAGADPALTDDEGRTPLHLAAHHRCLASVEALLAAGVAVDPVDYRERTPLTLASQNGWSLIDARLREAGADPERAKKRRKPKFPFFCVDKVHKKLEDATDTTYALDLRGKRLKAFPEEVLGCLNLRSLSLGRNTLAELPAALFEMHLLTELDLADNLFTTLPEAIREAPVLETLLLQNNPLDEAARRQIRAWLPRAHIVF